MIHFLMHYFGIKLSKDTQYIDTIVVFRFYDIFLYIGVGKSVLDFSCSFPPMLVLSLPSPKVNYYKLFKNNNLITLLNDPAFVMISADSDDVNFGFTYKIIKYYSYIVILCLYRNHYEHKL